MWFLRNTARSVADLNGVVNMDIRAGPRTTSLKVFNFSKKLGSLDRARRQTSHPGNVGKK